MVGTRTRATKAAQRSVWSDTRTILTVDTDYFRKLKHDIGLAAAFSEIEAFSYGAVARIFEAYAAVSTDRAKRSELECHPQLPFAKYNSTAASKKDPIADDDNSDHGSSGGDDDDSDDNNNSDGDGCNDSDDDDDRNDSDDGDCYSNDDDSNGTDIRGDEALARAIEQVNVQAAFTFDLLPNGEPSYYAFIIALDRFSLLHYIRPGTNKQAGGGMAGEEDHEADPGLDIPGLPPMPDIPKVVYWNQLIFTPGMKGFSTVFLDALACATKHLGLNHQPSWFDPKPGTTHGTRLREEFEQFLQREQNRGQNLVVLHSRARAKAITEIVTELAAEDALTPPNSEHKDATYIHEAESTTTSPATPKVKRVRRQRRQMNKP